jgi:hypothetical protein
MFIKFELRIPDLDRRSKAACPRDMSLIGGCLAWNDN